MEKPLLKLTHQTSASGDARLGAQATNAAHCTGVSSDVVQFSDKDRSTDTPVR